MLLETIEAKLRFILEETLDRLFYPGFSRSLSSQLVQLILAQIEAQPNGEKKAPDQIDILVSPEKWDAWQSAQDVLNEAAFELEKSLIADGFHFENQPKICVLTDPELNVDAIAVKLAMRRTRDRWKNGASAHSASTRERRSCSKQRLPDHQWQATGSPAKAGDQYWPTLYLRCYFAGPYGFTRSRPVAGSTRTLHPL